MPPVVIFLTKNPRMLFYNYRNNRKFAIHETHQLYPKRLIPYLLLPRHAPSGRWPLLFTRCVNAMLRHVKTSPPETVKAIFESCVTCGGPHPYYECLAADGNTFNASAAAATYNQNQGYRPQGETNYRASNQMGPPATLLLTREGDVKNHHLEVVLSDDGPPFHPRPLSQLPKGGEREPEVTKVTEQPVPKHPPSGDIRLLEELLNNDPSSPLPPKELHFEELKTIKSSIDDPPELSRGLPSHLNNARVNPKIHEVIKKEVIKLLDAGLIYPISDSPWVSPVHCVPKKGGMTVVENEDNELIPTRLVTGWRVCIDYRKLNDATRKDHFSLPFMDQMLERLAGNKYYCFLDGFSEYFQIPIDPQDQEKTTFTCPYGTFAYQCMPFSLCNAPGTFQRCMMAIFQDMIEETMEVFMDDFSVFEDSFS
ncbi:reverse transcriptase domain-containing protein [Tanacetum coccineum]